MLQQLSHEVENWKNTKPVSFDPIRFTPPSPEKSGRFPTVWMLSPFHGEYMPEKDLPSLLLNVDCSGWFSVLPYCKASPGSINAKGCHIGL
jgi:hypothetical protein